MASNVLMRYVEPSIGPRENNPVKSEKEMSLSDAARQFDSGYAVPVKKEDEKALLEERKRNQSPLGIHQAHRLPKPDHGPVCPCHYCK